MRSFLLILALLLSATPLAAQTAAPATPEAVVREHIAAQSAHELDRFLATLADTVRLHLANRSGGAADTVLVETREQLRARYSGMFQLFPAARFEILEHMVWGALVMTKERVTGLPGAGPATGVTVYRVTGGRIDAMWVFGGEQPGGEGAAAPPANP